MRDGVRGKLAQIDVQLVKLRDKVASAEAEFQKSKQQYDNALLELKNFGKNMEEPLKVWCTDTFAWDITLNTVFPHVHWQLRFEQLTRESNETHTELIGSEKQQKVLGRLKDEVREAIKAGEPELQARKEAAADASRKFKAGVLGRRVKDEPDSQPRDEPIASSGTPRGKARKARQNAEADGPDVSQLDEFPDPPEDLPPDSRPDHLQRDLLDFEARLANEEQLYAYISTVTYFFMYCILIYL